MRHYIVSAPFIYSVLEQINNQRFIIRAKNESQVEEIEDYFATSDKELDGIIFYGVQDINLKNLVVGQKTPISVFFKEKTSTVQELSCVHKDVRLYFPSHIQDSYFMVKELSQLGFQCGIYISNIIEHRWKDYSDLFRFYRENDVKIEPFYTIMNTQNLMDLPDVGSVFFDSPMRYLHVSEDGNISVCLNHLESNRFICNVADSQHVIGGKILEIKKIFNDIFIAWHECSSCQGWPICKGLFKDSLNNGYCKQLFSGIIEFKNLVIHQRVTANEDNNI